MQGYIFSMPLPADEFLKLLATYRDEPLYSPDMDSEDMEASA